MPGIAVWHCPNCGTEVTGIRDGEGYVRVRCAGCGAFMVYKRISRRRINIDAFAPKNASVV